MCNCADKLYMVDVTETYEGGRAEVVEICERPDHWPSNRIYAQIDGGARCTADLIKAQAVADEFNRNETN